MGFVEDTLSRARPDSVRSVTLPRRTSYYASPSDWRDEVIYFLLPDRFSDGQENTRPLLNPNKRDAFRPAGIRWDAWSQFRWDAWSQSGSDRYIGPAHRLVTA
jgi:hypothetical protein